MLVLVNGVQIADETFTPKNQWVAAGVILLEPWPVEPQGLPTSAAPTSSASRRIRTPHGRIGSTAAPKHIDRGFGP